MTAFDPPPKDMAQLVSSLLDEELSPQDHARLAAMLAGDAAARAAYYGQVRMHAQLIWNSHPAPVARFSEGDGAQVPSPPGSPILGFLGDSVRGALDYFSRTAPFSYLVAAALMGLGLWIGSLIPIPAYDPHRLAKDSPAVSYPAIEFVGWVTGMSGCRFSDPETEVHGFSVVPLGRKFALASGLMEITYATGAKVILEGPATFQVDTASSGYLSLGKLTGKVEKRVQGSGLRVQQSPNLQISKSQTPHPSSLIPHPFAVRTPTATVTDLGTEFGVEVDRTGATESHVLRGVVSVRPAPSSADGQSDIRAVVIRESESVRVEKAAGQGGIPQVTVLRRPEHSQHFVRSLPPAKERSLARVLAHFPLGEADPDAVVGKPVAEQTVNRASGAALMRRGSPTYTAETFAPGSTMAMRFSGAEGEYLYNPNFGSSPSVDVVLEAWVRVDQFAAKPVYVAYRGSGYGKGYGLLVVRERWVGFIPDSMFELSAPCELGKWTHVAVVCEPTRRQLWVDGNLASEIRDRAAPQAPTSDFCVGGAPESVGSKEQTPLIGVVDEVRLSEFRGPFSPKTMLMFFQDASDRSHSVPSRR